MTPAAPEIAFATMVRDDSLFLDLWIKHYARHVPKDHLFVLLDGLDQSVPAAAEGCQILRLPRGDTGPGWDRRRWAFLSSFATALLGRFDIVVLNDVDEIIVADPASGLDLVAALARAQEIGVISPFALEIVHRPRLEPEGFDPGQPVLGQRRFVRLNASYCKPCIISTPVNWSLGGHYADHPRLHLDEVLFLIHLRYFDRDILVQRQSARHMMIRSENPEATESVAGAGWSHSATKIEQFLASFEEMGDPIETDFTFGWQRRKIIRKWEFDAEQNIWRHNKLHNLKTYRLPERFFGLF